MRVAIVSYFGHGVSFAKRLQDEGHEVLMWLGKPEGGPLVWNRKVGTGIVARCDGWAPLLAWAKQGLAKKIPTLVFFDSSWMGKFADEARRAGLYTVGGGEVCDRLERDREFGKNVAREAGMIIPPFEKFANVEATIAYAKSGKMQKAAYFKTDSYINDDCTQKCDDAEELLQYLESLKDMEVGKIGANILEEKIEGVAVSTERWWNGKFFVGPYFGLIERKKLMAEEMGPSTGCAFNAVWTYPDKPMLAESLCWDDIGSVFLKNNVPPGLFDVNAILADGEAHFLEWCARLGYDSEPTGQMLYKDLGAWLWHVATGQGDGGGFTDKIAMSLHLAVPPYPCEALDREQKESPVGIHINGKNLGDLWSGPFIGYEVMAEDGQLMVGGPSGSIGLSAAVGTSLKKLAEETWEFAKDGGIKIAGLMARPDAGKCILEDAEKAKEEGFTDLPKGLYK
jgi:hypothetical protein